MNCALSNCVRRCLANQITSIGKLNAPKLVQFSNKTSNLRQNFISNSYLLNAENKKTRLIHIEDNPFKGHKQISFYNDLQCLCQSKILDKDIKSDNYSRQRCCNLPNYRDKIAKTYNQDDSFTINRKYNYIIKGGEPNGPGETDGMYFTKQMPITINEPPEKQKKLKRKRRKRLKSKKKCRKTVSLKDISLQLNPGQYIPLNFNSTFVKATKLSQNSYNYAAVTLSLKEIREYKKRELVKCKLAAQKRRLARMEKRKLRLIESEKGRYKIKEQQRRAFT